MSAPLAGLTVLVIEDEFLVADLLCLALEDAGATVAGIAGTLAEALHLAGAPAAPDLAVVDWNLGGERSDPVARLLIGRGVPFVVSTGYGALDGEFAAVPLIIKPYDPGQLVALLAQGAQTARSAR